MTTKKEFEEIFDVKIESESDVLEIAHRLSKKPELAGLSDILELEPQSEEEKERQERIVEVLTPKPKSEIWDYLNALRPETICMSCKYKGRLIVHDLGVWECPNCGYVRHTADPSKLEHYQAEISRNTGKINALIITSGLAHQVARDSYGYGYGEKTAIYETLKARARNSLKMTPKATAGLLFDAESRITKELIELKKPIVSEPDPRFLQPDLLCEIWKELEKRHQLDDEAKLAVFIAAITAYLPDDRDHVSVKLTGNSSEGKDNVMDAVRSLLPREDFVKVTAVTKSEIEDRIEAYKGLFISEINKQREGANSAITETLKQSTEGGITSWKKRQNESGGWVSNTSQSRQKTIVHATTEEQGDDELETRHIRIGIAGSRAKYRTVVENHLDRLATSRKIGSKRENWIARSIRGLDPSLDVVFPYAPTLKGSILDPYDNKQREIFDYNKPRVMRDSKRLYSLVKAVAWLHQKQRIIRQGSEGPEIVAEPSDLMTVLLVFSEFLHASYEGLDHRILAFYNKIKELEGKDAQNGYSISMPQYVRREVVGKELDPNMHRQTMKDRTEILYDMGLIEIVGPETKKVPGHPNYENGKSVLLKTENNPVNTPVKRALGGVTLAGLDGVITGSSRGLNDYADKEITPLILPLKVDQKHLLDEKGNLIKKNFESVRVKIHGVDFTGSKSENIPQENIASTMSKLFEQDHRRFWFMHELKAALMCDDEEQIRSVARDLGLGEPEPDKFEVLG